MARVSEKKLSSVLELMSEGVMLIDDDLGVAGYILKSNPANAFLEATALLHTYWRVVEFPAG